ncbi:MAG: hypothetical protein ACJAT7_003334 [Psychromonas sp.]|jgi:hypothetical protein|uniref:hypothetical protein n=1 Tax=Psychromonas sp. TaxID=1884585 RepID=UPI0039E6B5BC
MKILPVFTALCSALSLFACGGGSNDSTSTSFVITDANVKEVFIDMYDSSTINRFLSYSVSIDESSVAPIKLRQLINQAVTKQCESGNLKSNLSYDDENIAGGSLFTVTYDQCQLEGDTFNGIYSINTEGNYPSTATITMDLTATTMSIKGKVIIVEDQLGNEESNVNVEYSKEKLGQYTVRETTTTVQGVESGSGVATFANDSVTWVYVDNGLDVTLNSTGTTQFISLNELD